MKSAQKSTTFEALKRGKKKTVSEAVKMQKHKDFEKVITRIANEHKGKEHPPKD